MKLFCIVLVIYVLTLALCGVDGRGGTNKGLEKPLRNFFRARRHATDDLAPKGSIANEEPPPPPQFRSRRNAPNMSSNPDNGPPHVENEAPHLRQRRQLPPPPEGIPPPPEGLPPPPS